MAYSGFYQLENRDNGLFLSVVADDLSNMPPIECVISYCEKRNIQYTNAVTLRDAITKAKGGNAARISDITVTPFSGWAEYKISENGMSVTMIVYPPMAGMKAIDMQEIEGDLANLRVTYGIDKNVIQNALNNRDYYVPIEIAKGVEPVDGFDAKLIYNFNTTVSTKPKVNEDGTVDFHQLDLINKVQEGDVVASIIPEDPGKDGTNVYGAVVKPKKVYKKSFKYSGKELKVSEDGFELIATVTGHVFLQGEKIAVSCEYDVKSDVDNSTGDIDFEGNVHIRGNVRAGFKVMATGNVVVDGIVEGAEIDAGGDIILQRGIHGMNKGLLIAGGNIAANFIENATARAGKDIDTDAILHSKVSARGSITVHGRNGFMIGGSIRAGKCIEAKTIGSQMETSTEIGVGNDPELVAKIRELKKTIAKSGQDKEMLNQMLTLLRKKQETEGKLEPEKAQLLQKTMKNVILLDSQLKEQRAEYASLTEQVTESDDARIKITGSIYPGVKIEIYDTVYYMRDKNDYCQYVRKDGEIKRINL